MRRAAKIDANHGEIVDALTKAGCSVESLASMGGGVPDLLVGRGGVNYLLEVKDGSKPPSEQKLREDQRKFFQRWRGHRIIVESVGDALAAVGLQRNGVAVSYKLITPVAWSERSIFLGFIA